MMKAQKILNNHQSETQWREELRRGRWKREKLTGPPIFIAKTFQILESGQHSGVVTWSEDGTHFAILDVERFEQQILPAYFRHRNFSSFVRQLNMYDFHKIRNQQNRNIFEHRQFRRNSRHLLKNIRRKGCANRRTNDQQEEIVQSQDSPFQPYEEFSSKQETIRPTEATIEHQSQVMIPVKPAENSHRIELIEDFVVSLPNIIQSESEVREIIKKMKKDSKYKCLNSKEDVRRIVHKIRINKMKREDEDLEELSIEEQIMVQNVDDRELRYPTLAILTSQNYLPYRTATRICSLILLEEEQLMKK